MSNGIDLREDAFAMYKQGFKLAEIARQLNLPPGTVRRWKHTYQWDDNIQVKKLDKKPIRNLSDKRRLFCLYYVRYFNATKAYMRVYPDASYTTAATAGCRLLKDSRVQKEIERLRQERINQELLDTSDIFQRYIDIAFSDITDFVQFGQKEIQVMGPYGPIERKDPITGKKVPVTKIVNTVEFKDSEDVDGSLITEIKQGKDGAVIKLPDRMRALEWLADHMNLATPEQQARVKKLEVEIERIQKNNDEEENDGIEIINDCPQ